MDTSHVIGIVSALVVLLFVLEMLRRGILREKFAALWLLLSSVLLILAIFPQILGTIASWLGIAIPANLLFTLAAITLLLVCVQLSHEISRLENRTRRLAEEVALLRQKIEEPDRQDDRPGPRR